MYFIETIPIMNLSMPIHIFFICLFLFISKYEKLQVFHTFTKVGSHTIM